ncbi:MAG: CRISPR-associated RAMP protein [Chloroflexi bacterium]|nr:CRISPR-associated RAMP protein [Chloroflexota bacterium]
MGIRYFFTGRVVAETALHVGSGQGSARTDATVVEDVWGQPFIPGSSFKGALRSAVERLAPSLGTVSSCQLSNASGVRCLSVDTEWQEIYNRLREREPREEELYAYLTGQNPEGIRICDTCWLFGSPVFASRLKIADLSIVQMPPDTEIRHGVGIDRDTETAREGIKFDYEAIPPQAAFALEMILEDPTERDLGLLAVGLQEMRLGMIPLGGLSSRGTGRCRLELKPIVRVNLSDRQTLLRYLLQSVPSSEGLERQIVGEEIPVESFIEEYIRKLLQEKGG